MAALTRPNKIIMHWSGGPNIVTDLDREHYHFITDGSGKTQAGLNKPEANNDTTDGNYSAHTRGANTGAIGVSMAGMGNAVERPFHAGDYPLTEVQVKAFCAHVADLCDLYGIPVTRKTVLTHAEVQPTLGIRQNGKWDVNWLPGMKAPVDPVEAGDELRERIAFALATLKTSTKGWLK